MNAKNCFSRFSKSPTLLAFAGLVIVGIVFFNSQLKHRGSVESTAAIVVSSDHASSLTSSPAVGTTAGITQQTFEAADHPFDPLIAIADQALKEIDRSVVDYTATLNSQVFADDKLQEEKCLFCKIRHQRVSADGTNVPFSVYTKFLKPQSSADQEVIWVDGWHEGNLIAHLSGWGNLMKFYIDPTGSRAMDGNRHPIYDIGFRNLIVKMQDVAQRERERDESSVRIERGVKINDRICTLIEAIHPYRRDYFEFHIARIYIDDQLDLPIAYEGYSWPEASSAPPLIEKYYYTDIKLNVGLTDSDFDPANEQYNFPSR